MTIKFTLDHGGYVKVDGDIQIVGVGDDGAKHGEPGRCLQVHAHSKACATALLDFAPEIAPAVEADPDADPPVEAKAAVLGKSIRERMIEWFAQYDATPDDPPHVEMPTKTIRVRDDQGKLVDKQVEDRDL